MALAALEQRGAAGCTRPSPAGRARYSVRQTRSRAVRQQVMAAAATEAPSAQKLQRPDGMGRFGKFGGKFVPETLIPALAELEEAYQEAQRDPTFQVGPHEDM